MSKFFKGSDSESDSGSDIEEVQQQRPAVTTKVFQFSDDEEETKRVVRSAKDKRYEELQNIIKSLKNKKKIRDVSNVLTDFESLGKAFDKAKRVVEAEGIPRFYTRCLTELEDFVAECWEDKKKMNKANAKSLATLRQKLKKYNRDFEEEIAKYRENPDEGEGDEDADDEDDMDDFSDSEDEAPVASAFLKKPVEPKPEREFDDDDDEWTESSESDSDSDAPEDLTNMAAYFLKDTKSEQKEVKKKRVKKTVQKDQDLDEDEDGEGWKEVTGKGGAPVVAVLTNTLWYLTNQHETVNERSRKEKSVLGIPPTFDRFQGFNEYRRKKLKAQPLEAEQLKNHSDILYSLCMQPIMRSSKSWEAAYDDIKSLAECLNSYSQYLKFQNEKIKTLSKLDHPVRQVSEHTTVTCVKRCGFEVRQDYKLLDKAVCLADMYEPVFFDEAVHLSVPFENSMQKFRFFENLQLSVTVYLFKYCPGGGVVTSFCLVKVPENASESELASCLSSIILKIKPKFPEYHTRFMKKQFKSKIQNVANVQASVLDMLYKELAFDASVSSHPDTVQRVRMISMGETGLLSDLRHINPGRPSGQFDSFFEKLGETVEGYTAADDRRHNISHMSQILSVKDLINQTVEKCSEGTKIPSASLVRLQFSPRNPYAHSAMNFTSKIPVQYKIQRRQLRLSHPDDHYCRALFKYLKSLAIRIQPDCCLFFCDDKAKVPLGEPDVAISTGVRGKLTLAPSTSTISAADHDLHHKASLTPSVYMNCTIPESIDKSFYRGKVTVAINDSVTQPSNPMRHACALVRAIEKLEAKPSVVLKFTDGGTDHRCNLEHVKCAAICIFKELDLDFYVAARCAPGQSWTNPAERVMAILNIGLQNCALSRERLSDEDEKVIKKCSSMDSVRKELKAKPELKQAWEGCIEPVRQCIENRFRRLALKDEPINVQSPMKYEEIDYLSRHLNFMFPGLDTENLVKSHTKKIDTYNRWIEQHCRERTYSFQIRKCQNAECCSPPPKSQHSWLPDPMLSEEDANHYKPFEMLYGQDTDESDRPTLKSQNVQASEEKPSKMKKVVLSKDPLVTIIPEDPVLKEFSNFTAQHARYVSNCTECEKPRLIYSKLKLSERQKVQLVSLLSEHEYSCGSPVTVPGCSLHGKIFARLNIDCSSPVETSYYSSDIGHKDICYYCGKSGAEIDLKLKESYKSVYPVCNGCKAKGLQYPCMRPFGKGKNK